MKKSFYFFSVLLILSIPFLVKTADRQITKFQPVEKAVESIVKNGQLVGAEILIIENNKPLFHKSFGWADREQKKELKKNSIWNVASMTKPFTATAILMLADDGKLSLDDPLTKYLPGYKGNSKVLIRHLLAMSSGDDGKYRNGGYSVLDFDNHNDWIMDWAKQKNTGTFGKFAYSGFNYGALGIIIEKVSNQSLESFIQERIVKPLSLTETFFKYTPDVQWKNRVPARYQWNEKDNRFDQWWTAEEYPAWKFYNGSMGLWMTAKDYATFMQMWLNNGMHNNIRLLKESTVREALKIHVNAYGEKDFGHGLGWFIEDNPLTFRYGGGSGVYAKAIPSKNTIIIYMNHCGINPYRRVFEDALDSILFNH
ncbi:MAG: beta-lactamase family protein [Gammaproteobacteria bacterium]|nr:beta-lactamase family protein [Gammaproteobacteria bacterium]